MNPETYGLILNVGAPGMFVAIFYDWLPRGSNLRNELRPPILYFIMPLCLITITTVAIWGDDQVSVWLNRICLPFWVFMWIRIYKDDHDDRWKKRRKKIAAKVKVVGQKLVVVPT